VLPRRVSPPPKQPPSTMHGFNVPVDKTRLGARQGPPWLSLTKATTPFPLLLGDEGEGRQGFSQPSVVGLFSLPGSVCLKPA